MTALPGLKVDCKFKNCSLYICDTFDHTHWVILILNLERFLNSRPILSPFVMQGLQSLKAAALTFSATYLLTIVIAFAPLSIARRIPAIAPSNHWITSLLMLANSPASTGVGRGYLQLASVLKMLIFDHTCKVAFTRVLRGGTDNLVRR